MNALEIINNANSRKKVLSQLPVESRIKASTLIESYERLRKSRLRLVDRLYANKALQREDAALQYQQKAVRDKLDSLISLVK